MSGFGSLSELKFQRSTRRRMLATVAMSCMLVATAGCGGGGGADGKPRASASGKAMFDGKPIPAGFVVFTHNESGTMASCPISEGEYASVSGQGPLIGANTISVSALDKVDGQPLFGGGKTMEVNVETSGYTGDVTLAADDVMPAAAVDVDEEMQQATK
jgi:hypothetical protein